MNERLNTSYDKRIARVCDYIDRHLDEELSLDRLSQVACLSKYHFHRLFSCFTGMSVTRYIQQVRMRKASFRLAFEPKRSVLDLALDAGFDSPEAFARAFKRISGQTPSDFRSSPDWPQWHSRFNANLPLKGDFNMKVDIIDFPETRIALIEHLGPKERVLETASQFIAWRKDTGLSPVTSSKTFGIPRNDPNVTPPEEFRFDIGGSIDSDVPDNSYGVKTASIAAGRCAVIRHQGSHDRMDDSIYYLYRDWLPQSGEELRDFPCFFQYLNLVHQVEERELLTDIFLPIQ